MNIDPHPSYDDNPRNVKTDIENAKVTVTWKTSDGGNATLSADLDKASFLSVYPRPDDYHLRAETWGDVGRLETPQHMALIWTPKIGWAYTVKKEDPMNEFERKALAEAARDANNKLQRAKRQEQEAQEVYEQAQKTTEKALEKYNALSKYEEDPEW